MKRLVLTFVLLCCVPAWASSATQAYIWPNCDSTHPCVVYHFTTVASGTASGETLQDLKIFVAPSRADNLLILAVTRPSGKTLSTPTDDKSNTWVAGPSATNSTDAATSEIWYKCGAAAGTSVLTLHFSSALASGDTGQISYTEVSGIATSSCIDGTATGANGLLPYSTTPIQPGAITTTQANSLVYNYAQTTYRTPQDKPAISSVAPDDADSLLSANLQDKTVSAVQVQASAGSVNPALYIVDPTSSERWNDLAIAFKASSGEGTQPSGITVVRTISFYCCGKASVSMPFPSSGNAFVMTTGQDAQSGDWPITNVSNGYDTVHKVTGSADPPTDPQAFYICSATTGGQTRITWTQGNQAHFVFYDIAGASSSCFDTSKFTAGSQPGKNPITVTNAITPTTSNGLIIGVAYYGTGPETAVTAPSGAVMDNIWATGMSDTDKYSYGDGHLHYYNPSTSAVSFTITMNDAGGTWWNWLFLALKAQQAAPAGVRKRVVVTR
ncbi:MAG: hypothetical protein LAN70_18875 [Acidobacteriia bacterium]|nr:hypothetical protein [Terriglobia bacterium]